MGKNRSKYEAALEFIREREWLKSKIPRFMVMKHANLYVKLVAAGCKWSIPDQKWYEGGEAPALASADTTINTRTSGRKDKVLVRIITHNAVRDKVVSEIVELVEALNYIVESVSQAYANDGGEYSRTYINLRRDDRA